MKTSHKILAILIAAALLIVNAPAVLALPPMPSSFYGTVKANNANVSIGTPVTAWINGVQYASAPATLFQSDTVYSIDVPGDDLATPSVIEGGREGDTIVFRMGTQTTADQTGIWHSGTNVSLNLSANPTAVHVQGLSARVSGGGGQSTGRSAACHGAGGGRRDDDLAGAAKVTGHSHAGAMFAVARRRRAVCSEYVFCCAETLLCSVSAETHGQEKRPEAAPCSTCCCHGTVGKARSCPRLIESIRDAHGLQWR